MGSGLKWCVCGWNSVSVSWFYFPSLYMCVGIFTWMGSRYVAELISGLSRSLALVRQIEQAVLRASLPEKVQVDQAEVKDPKCHCAEGRILCAYWARLGHVPTPLPQGVIISLTALPGTTRNSRDVLRNQERVANHMVDWNAEVVSLIQHCFFIFN